MFRLDAALCGAFRRTSPLSKRILRFVTVSEIPANLKSTPQVSPPDYRCSMHSLAPTAVAVAAALRVALVAVHLIRVREYPAEILLQTDSQAPHSMRLASAALAAK